MNNKKTKKTARKLDLHKETLLQLNDLSTVNGGADATIEVQISDRAAAGGSWVLCCRKGDN